MKYIKTYENNKNKNLQINDYILCKKPSFREYSSVEYIQYCDFISNNIGQITKNMTNKNISIMKIFYAVKYDNIPIEIKNFFTVNEILLSEDEIYYWSKNKKDLDIILQANKYNL